MRLFQFIANTFVFLLSCIPATHAADYVWTTQFSLWSDYYSRGISQTQEMPAPQILSYIYHPETGLYGGIFVSRVRFADNHEADAEADVYAGIQKYVGKFNYKAGLIHYSYPNADDTLDYNFTELDLAAGYDFDLFSATAALKYSPNYFADSGDEFYYTIDAQVPFRPNLRGIAHIGYREIEDNTKFYWLPDNTDWAIGGEFDMTKKIKITGKYVDSDFGETECPDICRGRLIGGITYNF